MTESTHSTLHPQQATHLDDEIDLRQYILVLLQWWREIVVTAFALALLAGLAVLALRLLPSKYEASSEVAIVRVQSDVTFDEKFITKADEQPTTNNASPRRSALISFASSNAIAQKVIEKVGDLLSENERAADKLLQNVNVASGTTANNRTTDSDLIRITVTASTPQKAATLATTWAQVFVEQANQVYGQTPADLVTSVENALTDAQSVYDKAQQALTAFLTQNQSATLERQIQQRDQAIKGLLAGQQSAIETILKKIADTKSKIVSDYLEIQGNSEILAYTAKQESQQELLRTYIAAQYQSQLDVFRQQFLHDQQLLSTYTNAAIRLQKTLTSAKVLKKQIEASSETVDGGTVAALQLLKIQTFSDVLERSTPPSNESQLPSLFERQSILLPDGQDASTTPQRPINLQIAGTPLQLQINTEQSMSKSVALNEVDSLMDAIDAQLTEINDNSATLSKKLLSGEGYTYLEQNVPISSTLVTAIDKQNEALLNGNTSISSASTLSSTLNSADLLPDLQTNELEQIARQYSSFDPATTQVLNQLEEEIRQLRSQYETVQAQQRELNQQRDLAWSTLTTVKSKVAELTVAQAAGSSEVRFAAPAVEPTTPVKGTSLILAVAAGGMAGLLLAIFYAFIASFMGQKPFLQGAVR
ncbi:MAG: hypothetical protein U0175_15055 [Caldilineaceae bacterium]